MSFLFPITLLNIMPNRLLLLILHCLFWVNQISWCQICAIWHLLLLANYWRKDKLVTVHAAISAPCGKGSSSPATQYATYSKSVLGLEGEEPAVGGQVWNPGARWDGCRQHWQHLVQAPSQTGAVHWQGNTVSKGGEKLQLNPSKIKKSLLISRLICVFHHLMFSHLY